MADSPVTVPVVFVGNDDIPRHIKALKGKKTSHKATSKLSTKFVEATIGEQSKKSSKKTKTNTLSEDLQSISVQIASSVLLDNESNQSGTNVYSFKTPKRSKQMSKFAESVRKKTDETSSVNTDAELKKSVVAMQAVTRTQYALQHNVEEASSSDSGDSSDSSEDEIMTENGDTKTTSKSKHLSSGLQLPSERELYFDTHGGKKNKKQLTKTSDHTLQKLKNPQLNPDQLSNALLKHSNEAKNIKEVQEVVAAKDILCKSHKQMFVKWLFHLCNNFNVMLFGLGSKRQLIHSFCSEYLSNQSKLVVNGFFPSLSIKSILMSICEEILEHTVSFSNIELQIQQICSHYSAEDKSDRLFLVVHNIDGMCLRNSRAQTVLSQLASCPRIHILASIDHINAPLIWDQTMQSQFNWLWYDVTTFSPYREETSYEGSLLLSGAGSGIGARGAALALSGLLHVARSLTSNARGVFRILAEHQIDLEEGKSAETEDAVQEDLSFSELYQKCREKFLVNSELTLRAHLTEFLDHKLAQIRKGADGGEYLSVPVDIGTLKEYLDKE